MPSAPAEFRRGARPDLRIALQPHPRLPWLLVPGGMPLQVLIDAEPVRVPNTRPWFLGVASQRGVLLPVIDLAGWAGLDGPPGQRRHLVALGAGAHACAVPCHIAPTLLVVADAIPESTGDDEGALEAFLGQRVHASQGIARDFDAPGWFIAAARQIPGDASG